MGPTQGRGNYRQKCLKNTSQKWEVLTVLPTVPSYPAQSKELSARSPPFEHGERLRC